MYKRTILWLIVLVAAAGLTTSCLLDPEKTKEEPEDKTPVVFKDLTEKDDVLHNLELSYNERRFDKYEEDADFIFYFAEVDYNNPNGTPEQWGRVEEVGANSRLLSPSTPGDNKVVSIDLKLEYITDSWTEEPPNAVHPDESWFIKIVDYDLVIITAADWQFKAIDKQAQFTIRLDEDTGKYQIRLWHDLADG
jgi:hypothetical protein